MHSIVCTIARAAALVGALSTGLVAALPAQKPNGRRPLTLVDSVLLRESDSTYLGRPATFFAIGSRGSLFIPDQLSDLLYEYSSRGDFLRTIGRRGRGPGEMLGVGITTLVSDSFVSHATTGRTIHTFSLADGKWRGRRFVRGFVTSAAVVGDTIYFGNFDVATRRGLLKVARNQVVTADSSPVDSRLAPFPHEYAKYPDLDMFNSVLVAAWRDTVVVGYAGTDYVVLHDLAGTPRDTVRIPVRERRGIPHEALDLFRSGAATFADRLKRLSGLYGLWRLPDGSLALWHNDGWSEGPPARPSEILGVAWLSILLPGLDRACVDIPMPIFDSGIPRMAMRADTLYALDQVVPPDPKAQARSVIRRYRVDPSACPPEWLRSLGR